MRKLILFLLMILSPSAVVQAHADTCNGFAANLVSNCGFETGSLSSWSGTAVTAGPNYAGVDTRDPFTTSPTPYNGRYEAYFGNPSTTIALTQTLTTVNPYGTYLIEFALLNDTGPSTNYTNSFLVLFGGNPVFTESAVAAGPYTLYMVSGTSTSSSTALSFVSRNDGGFFELDSVSVVGYAPEPSSWVLLGTGILGAAGLIRPRLRVLQRARSASAEGRAIMAVGVLS